MDVLSLMKSWWSCPAKVENMAEEMTEKFCPDAQGISDYWSLFTVVVFTHTSLFVTTKLPVYMIVLKAALSLTLTII